ncbi:MAG: sulfite exporter TauE/SafE family protein, partial [Gammaproteobacteria bacterium]|nr:sulfite exporter TauE/SafE family protein [Gammaproteobacteria bacterium]
MRAGTRAGERNDGSGGCSSRRRPLTGNALPRCQARVGPVIAGVGSRVVTVRVSLIGFTAGFLNGLIGIGGGVVMVPGLIEYRRASPQVAVGSSLAAMVVFSAIALLVHASASGLVVDPVWLAVVIVCGVMGSQIGTGILARLATRWLLLLFAGLVLLVSTRLLVQG